MPRRMLAAKGRHRERPAADRRSSSGDASRAAGDAAGAVLGLPDALPPSAPPRASWIAEQIVLARTDIEGVRSATLDTLFVVLPAAVAARTWYTRAAASTALRRRWPSIPTSLLRRQPGSQGPDRLLHPAAGVFVPLAIPVFGGDDVSVASVLAVWVISGHVAGVEHQTVAVGRGVPGAEGIRQPPGRSAVAGLGLENGRYAVLEFVTLVKIAKALRCSMDQLLAGLDPDYDRMLETGGEIPVIAEGAAFPAGGRARGQEPAEMQRLPRPGDLQDPRAYGVRIRSDSMFPAHRPAMVAIVSPRCRVRDGDEVYVHLVSGECLVRVVHTVEGCFLLEPYNPAYRPRLVEKTEVQTMHVIVYSRRREVLTDDIERVAGVR